LCQPFAMVKEVATKKRRQPQLYYGQAIQYAHLFEREKNVNQAPIVGKMIRKQGRLHSPNSGQPKQRGGTPKKNSEWRPSHGGNGRKKKEETEGRPDGLHGRDGVFGKSLTPFGGKVKNLSLRVEIHGDTREKIGTQGRRKRGEHGPRPKIRG